MYRAGGDGFEARAWRREMREQRGDRQEEHRRHQHAAHRAQHGHGGGLGVGQRAGGELLLQIEPDHQEEHREQTVLRPVAERKVDVRAWDGHMRFGDGFEQVRRGGQVRQNQAEQGECEHDEA